jgi:hypothetical protein
MRGEPGMEQIMHACIMELKPGKVNLKACGPLGHVGSNPTPGANFSFFLEKSVFLWLFIDIKHN